MKAEVAIMKQDTLLAEKYIDRAIELDPYHGTAWSMKAILLLSRDSCVQAEDALNRHTSHRLHCTKLGFGVPTTIDVRSPSHAHFPSIEGRYR